MNLNRLKYTPFTSKEVEPNGWLKQQLQLQADGLCGHLDEVWPDVRDSKWVGGRCEGWERMPYWLDGYIQLAFLLKDAEKMKRAEHYVSTILEKQNEDGWLCPCSDEERAHYDVWATFLICKVLVVYYECSSDTRIEDAVCRAMYCLNLHLEKFTLFDWGQTRWFECLIPLFWLYNRRPEEWIEELIVKLYVQGADYVKLFDHWVYQKPQNKGRWNYLTHVVNMAMALKSEALIGRVFDTSGNEFAKKMLSLLQKFHGMATDHFTGDECLSGTSPIQGSECCSVVEAMYSYEQLISISGDSFWSDMLERTAYNALPATLSDDMWSHQYDQVTNQVECTAQPKWVAPFRTNSGESHLFGLEPTYGCCTANFGQGWPKLALSAIMRSEEGLVITAIAPVLLKTQINGVVVSCEIKTAYPFRDNYTVAVITTSPVEFELQIRIPGFCKNAHVDGVTVAIGQEYSINRVWNGEQEVNVTMCFEAAFNKRPNGLVCLNRGPLLFALPIETEWKRLEFVRAGVERKYPYCDYELLPKAKWNYAFTGEHFTIDKNEISGIPFSSQQPPITICTDMAPIAWSFKNGFCAEIPEGSTALSLSQKVKLIPYGCTKLRITETKLLK